ncbi:TetR/AcrR family transcriptional regulator [Providencia rettgeri]|uniref:TetR/AcrR family transcriptional regulator n=1 Tax=Providencia rettgeri TaxID=587 RepID=UPI0005B34431|nr:TetR/AcrR family transcriptional regulator [Providencia rettgeri]
MKKLTRTSWINAGFNILDNEGYTRCSVERVARKLDVTRGSFYHHFNDREDFIRSMLSCWVVEYTDKILNELEQETSINKVLTEYINFTSRKKTAREISIRAWALHDPIVAEYQTIVDEKRLNFVINKLGSLPIPAQYAQTIGKLVHLSLIGGTISGERLNNLNFNKLILNGVKLKKFLF